MTSARIQQGLHTVEHEDELTQIAKALVNEISDYFDGIKGKIAKQLVQRIKRRFDRDNVSDQDLSYIINQLLEEFGNSGILKSGFRQIIDTERKPTADLIVSDIQAALNGRCAQALKCNERASRIATDFERRIIQAGVPPEKAFEVAKIMWQEVQRRLRV